MEVTLYQLGVLFVWGVLIATFFVLASKKMLKSALFVAILGSVLFLVPPVRHVEQKASSLEYNINRFDSMPDKVTTNKDKFNTRQQKEYESLKTQSEEINK